MNNGWNNLIHGLLALGIWAGAIIFALYLAGDL